MILETLLINSKGNVSKTKVGAILLTASVILAGAGKLLTGEADLVSTINALVDPVGTLLVLIGLRDAIK